MWVQLQRYYQEIKSCGLDIEEGGGKEEEEEDERMNTGSNSKKTVPVAGQNVSLMDVVPNESDNIADLQLLARKNWENRAKKIGLIFDQKKGNQAGL